MQHCDGVEEGGPEAAKAHSERTLLLMWPDYGGRGGYGCACLEAYDGSTLALVGEWSGRSLGAYAPGLPETGQSFSAAFQAQVEAEFELESVTRLPNWPYFYDCLMIWRRHAEVDVD